MFSAKHINALSGYLRCFGVRSVNFKVWGKKNVETKMEEPCRKPLEIPEETMEACDLKNGMRLVCEHKCSSNITTVGCFLPAGAMYEKPEERGGALFMEHLLFRTTRCRNQQQLEQELEEIGGRLAAVAMRDMFLFYGSAPCYEIDKLVALLADVVLNGVICDEDIINERFVILRELCEIETDGERVVMDYLPAIAYQETELARSLYPETRFVKNMCAENLANLRERLFKPRHMTMVSTGGTSFCEIQRSVGRHFMGVEQDGTPIEGEITMKTFPTTPCFRFSGSELRFRDDDEKLAHVAVAIEGPGYANCQDNCALTVAKEIVGSWDRTFGGGAHNAPYIAHAMFEDGVCHIYKSFNIGWTHTGLWGCYFAAEKLCLEDTLFMIQREWMRLCTTITAKEVARAVNQCRTREFARLNDSVDRFFDIATCMFRRGRYEPLHRRLAQYEKVSADVIRDVANEYIYDRCPAVAAIGPVENLPDYLNIRQSMYLMRT